MAFVGDCISFLASKTGATDAGIRLLLSLFAGYPLAMLYRRSIHGKSADIQHVFFTVCGIMLTYFNFGTGVMHSIINILIIYVLIVVCGGTAFSVVAAFFINTTYLIVAYWYTSTEFYDIKWSTPHCVLTLRLTGVVVDIFDGRKREEKLSADQKMTKLEKKPSLLELMGHTYFFGGVLVGPQFSMMRYRNFVAGLFNDKVTNGPAASVAAGMGRLGMGMGLVAMYQIGSLYFPDEILLSDRFNNYSFIWRIIIVIIWGNVMLYKYIGCWTIAEGVGVVTGLTYNGKDKNGNELWDACSSVRLRQFVFSTTLRQAIQAFNINTNAWMASYVFKRLRFLGNKQLSQVVTLIYLALWHGLHSGYYNNFFIEFVSVIGENQIAALPKKLPILTSLNSNPSLQPLLWVVKKFMVLFTMSYALVAFALLSWDKYSQVYASIYWCGHILFVGWILFHLGLQMILNKKPAKDKSSHETTTTEDSSKEKMS